MNLRLTKLASAMLVTLLPVTMVQAQQQSEGTQKVAAAKKPAEESQIEQIVVTGKASGISGLRVDASYAITNVSAENIERLNPKSTAELFTLVPGVWSESSGGVSGANVFVRGFPGGGDAPFLTVQLQGVPVFPPPTLSFLENSSMFRLDETVDFMEALRGGSTPVISNGQPGLTTNFILKEGSEETEGLVKVSTSDYGLQRVDALISGELADDLYFMMGGYVSSSQGIRDAGFNSEEGHQLTLNITKDLDNGRINFYTRQTDDHGVWYLPTPLNVAGVDNTYTQIGPNNRQATIEYGPNGESRSFDFGDGRGWKGSVSGGSVDLDLENDWKLLYRFNYTQGDANTLGLVPEAGAVTLGTVADNGLNATGATTGTLYDADTMVQQIGRWVVEKELDSFTNDLAVTKTADSAKYTLGVYSTAFSVNDWWSIGNQAWHVVGSGGEALTGINCNDNDDSCSWNYDIDAAGDGTTRALYAAVEVALNEQWTVDLGLRNENHTIDYTVDEGLTGKVSKAVSYDESKIAWTAGVNWMWQKNMGVFARVNKGNKMPFFDDFRDNYTAFTSGEKLIKEVTQFELGYKWAEQNYSFYATSFYNQVEGDTFVRRPGDPAEVMTNRAYGVELDFNYFTSVGFSLNLNSTLQKTEITESPTNEGNQAQRQPKWQVRLTPSYGFEAFDTMFASVYGTVSAVSDRYSNNENTVTLPGYTKVDLGVQLELTEQLKTQLSVDNLTDKQGLTEGDPRNPTSPNGRYILPRSVTLSMTYQF
ncbi:MAG: TonB-dependent receptor [Gammaproteobacteria bacterium]|nr:TonB-dependent receptor [Gammaproteobacteria bacterium]MBU2056906.1 TonB-dependent receptor [Gammaproteobacteria bacterium]MBU2174562.1 TonB-dependent receptor [Gammaproteobacteria bacterium]MBU2248254.1 TonB-dependent receptor [Gammaproteobacteria bacterium]MBU2343741.1 TonB-dependent receptor [Gammaproteobacteria bacterium]